MAHLSRLGLLLIGWLALWTPAVAAHPAQGTVSEAAQAFLDGLRPNQRAAVEFAFDDGERFAFRWTPGRRGGITLKALDAAQTTALQTLLHHVLSHAGRDRVDAIIATEAALAVIEQAPATATPGSTTRRCSEHRAHRMAGACVSRAITCRST